MFTKVAQSDHPGNSGGRRGISQRHQMLINAVQELAIGEGIIVDPEAMGVDPEDDEAITKLRTNVASAIRRHLDHLRGEGWRFRVYFDRDGNLIAARVAPLNKGETPDADDTDSEEAAIEEEYEEVYEE